MEVELTSSADLFVDVDGVKDGVYAIKEELAGKARYQGKDNPNVYPLKEMVTYSKIVLHRN